MYTYALVFRMVCQRQDSTKHITGMCGDCTWILPCSLKIVIRHWFIRNLSYLIWIAAIENNKKFAIKNIAVNKFTHVHIHTHRRTTTPHHFANPMELSSYRAGAQHGTEGRRVVCAALVEAWGILKFDSWVYKVRLEIMSYQLTALDDCYKD